MSRRRKRIAIIHENLDTWVRKDMQILAEEYEVREAQVPCIWTSRRNIPANLRKLLRQVIWADLVFFWYTDMPTAVGGWAARALRRKSMATIMGYEVASVPEIGYGRTLQPGGPQWVKRALHSVDQALAVSEATRREANEHVGTRKSILTLYHGFTAPTNTLARAKARLALTVSFVRWGNVKKKGIETFVRSAKFLADVPFVVLGDWLDDSVDYLRGIAPANVQFLEVRGNASVLESFYSTSKVYVQASAHESFGCAVAEAMLYGCVPVVSCIGALPEVVGDTGYYAEAGDAEGLARQIEVALREGDGRRARDRIIEHFPLEKRREGLLRIVHDLLGDA